MNDNEIIKKINHEYAEAAMAFGCEKAYYEQVKDPDGVKDDIEKVRGRMLLAQREMLAWNEVIVRLRMIGVEI